MKKEKMISGIFKASQCIRRARRYQRGNQNP